MQELAMCNNVLAQESNEKEIDFNAKNMVLQEYQLIDADKNILFKGKVAKVISSADQILLTQLVFSGKLKDLTDPEILALLAILVERSKVRANKILQTEISEKFCEVCLYLEEEASKLLEIEHKYGV